MGWTTEEVDKYVAKLEKNITGPTEKNLKGYAFARMYKEANNNEKAKRYLETYLSVNETDFRGHKMMGEILEELGDPQKALISYKRSLSLNNTQHDVVLKVVELYRKVPADPLVAKAWADRAALHYPGHNAVFRLRMHLLESAGKIDYEEMEDLITSEMPKRPRDVGLHIALVRIYNSTKRSHEAYKHCVSVIKTKAFKDSPDWWRCAVDVFEKYMANEDKRISPNKEISQGHQILDLHAHLLDALCQLLNLYLKTESIRECKNIFYRFDCCLNAAYDRKVGQLPHATYRTEWEVVHVEMRAQLYQHLGTLALKLAKENYLTWPRALRLASVCYLSSAQIPEPEINTPWVATANKNKDSLRWYHMACHRLSQSGHILSEVAKKYGKNWLDECVSDLCTLQGQDEIVNTIYNQQQDLSKSFLSNDKDFYYLEVQIPSIDQMLEYDQVSICQNPANLQQIVWIGLHWHQHENRIRPGVGVIVNRLFESLRMDAHNIEQTAAETLCLRDLEAFLYAVIRTSAAKHLEDLDVYRPDHQPEILPQQLCVCLSSQAQEEWWTAAYKFYSGAASVTQAGQARSVVQRGLEVIRAVGNHGMHVRLLIFLAFNMADKAAYLKAASTTPWHYEAHWKSLQTRSRYYWEKVLEQLEKLMRNENVPARKKPLFEPLKNLKPEEIKFNIQRARLIIGEALFREARIEEAMEMFEQVKTVQGMWNLAQIYQYLANVEAQAAAAEDLGDPNGRPGSPAHEYYKCLNEAKYLLLLCLEKVDNNQRLWQTLQDELIKIEDRLSTKTKKQLDFRQLNFQSSVSSITSDVQEFEDSFWIDQPEDGNTKDLIATLSEMSLNNGYLQEQVALRDQYVQDLTKKYEYLEKMRPTRQSQDERSADLVAKLNDVTINSGFLQEQLAVQDQKFLDLFKKYESLESEVRELKQRQFSGVGSPASASSQASSVYGTPSSTIGSDAQGTPGTKPTTVMSSAPTTSPQQISQTTFPTESTPVIKKSVKSRLGPRPVQPQPPKIPLDFFAGLSQSNSPEKRQEEENLEDEHRNEDEESDHESQFHSTSCDDGMHFEPLIPLPKKIEKKTGEEGENVLFEKRAKLYRFVKDDKAWKERGHGTIKILSSQDSSKFRIVMRRDYTLKICANHFIAADMELKPGAGKGNSLVWTTHADYADEIPSVEQLAVRFKLQEEATEFQDVFDSCKAKLSGAPEDLQKIISPKPTLWKCSSCSKDNQSNITVCATCGLPKFTNTKFPMSNVDGPSVTPDKAATSPSAAQSLFEKFTPKPGTWECNDCLVNNQPSALSCVACGKANPSTTKTLTSSSPFGSSGNGPTFGQKITTTTQQSLFGTNTSSTFASFTTSKPAERNQKEAISFDFKPHSSSDNDTDKAKPNKAVFAAQPATPFSFTPTSGSPLNFSFGPTQVPSPSSSSAITSKSPHAFPTLFGELSAPKSSDKSSNSAIQGFSFGSPTINSKTNQSPDKPLTFSASPNAGFGLSDDEEDKGSNKPIESSDQTSLSASKDVEALPVTATTIMPQLFWQQQPEEKFKFGNLHKTQPLAGMAPVVAPITTKSNSTFPASFVLSQIAAKSTQESQVTAPSRTSKGTLQLSQLQQPEMLMSILQGKPKGDQLPFQKWTTTAPVGDTNEYDDYSEDDDYDTESEYTESYTSSEDDLKENESKSYKQRESALHEQVNLFGDKSDIANLQASGVVDGRKVLAAHSAIKKDQALECVFVYQKEASKSDRDKATRLMLPPNFFSYTSLEPCKGCLGCDETKRSALTEQKDQQAPNVLKTKSEEKEKKQSCFIFGTKGKNMQSFSSVVSSSSWATTKKDTPERQFPMAGQQLFSSAVNEDCDPSEEPDIYFKPLIALPELVDSKSGEDEYTVLFSQRARLYRFDATSSMWKERGIGDIKLLLDDNTGRGRVVMRRDQIHKLCANHWITKDMELLSNSTSERSWVWQTLSDLSEEVPSQEKLAVRFKTPESAKKFKEVFEDLVAKAQNLPTSTGVKEPIKAVLDKKDVDTWNCDACYCPNSIQDTNCIACGAANPESAISGKNVAVKEGSLEPSKPEIPASKFMPTFVTAKPVFTIGWESGPEEDIEPTDHKSSPSKSSPSKSPIKSSFDQATTSKSIFGSGLGSTLSGKFNFRLDLKPDDGVRPKSPVKSPVKSPQSPNSPGSPDVHPETEDDGIHFEPVISLPKLVSKMTGEENEKPLFSNRAKVYRFDGEGNQWKERGIGEVKILANNKSGRSRILMRRDNVLKICVNHQITPEMELNPKTEKSWVWSTPADFADEISRPETLAIRFKTSEIAAEFKDAFDKARQFKKTDHPSNTKEQLPQNVDDTDSTQKQMDTKEASSKESKKEGSFTSSSVSVTEALKASPQKPSPRKESESEDYHNADPHFEPIIPLPDKVEVKTGEEEEDIMFSHRAKLFRFDRDSKQWKERGLGDIKILYNDKNNRARILMRREQIHKICANHYILPEMTLSASGTSNKSWVWNTLADFSDEEVKGEQLAVRFKFEAPASEFKKTFEECKAKVAENKSQDKTDKQFNVKGSAPNAANTASFMDKFTPKPGTWECEVCCIPNESTSPACLACQTANPSSSNNSNEPLQPKFNFGVPLKPPQSTEFKFNFGNSLNVGSKSSATNDNASLTDKFKPPEGSWECDSCLVQNKPDDISCAACHAKRPGSESNQTNILSTSDGPQTIGVTFGAKISNSQVKPTFNFGSAKPTGFSFGSSNSNSQSKQTFGFGELQPTGFSFGSKPTSDHSTSEKKNTVSSFSFGKVESTQPTSFSFGSSKAPDTTAVSEKPEGFGSGFVFGKESKQANDAVETKSAPTQKEISNDSVGAGEGAQSFMEKFHSKQGAWECDTCLIQNTAETLKCAACQTPKPGESQSASAPSFSFVKTESPQPTGFSFTSFKANNTNTFTFGQTPVVSQEPAGFGSGFIFGSAQKPFSTKVNSDSIGQSDTADEGTEPLTEKFRPKQGAWECDTCLIQNTAGTSKCAACQTPKPGSHVGEIPGTLPPFNFGTAKPLDFLTKNKSQVFSKDKLQGSSKSTGECKPPFIFGESMLSTSNTDDNVPAAEVLKTKLLDLPDVPKVEADSTGSPEMEEIYSSIFPDTLSHTKNEPSQSESIKSEPNDYDLMIVKVVEPTNEEKEQARRFLLPDGFYLSMRQDNPTQKPKPKTKDVPPKVKEDEQKRGAQSKVDEESPNKSVFGSVSSSSFASFSELSATTSSQFGGNKSQGFAGQGTQLFSSNQGDDENPSAEHDIHFEPIVSLPQVEVQTGEEKEEKVFSHRAKLYRFDKSISQWKERGVGDIKILKLKDGHKFRVVMRRDQIHKLCANHIITMDMKLVPNSTSECSWVWNTLADLSEEEPAPQQFAVRFKTSDKAKEFKKAFEECQESIISKPAEDWPSEENSEEDNSAEDISPEQPSSDSKDFGNMLASAGELLVQAAATPATRKVSTDNHWECKSCSTLNLEAQPKCFSCGVSQQLDSSLSTETTKCSQLHPPNLQTTQDCSSSTESKLEDKQKTGFLFGTSSVSSLSFSDAAQSNRFGNVSSSEAFSFKGLNDPRPNQDIDEGDEHDEGYHNVSGDHIHFDPIIPLPEKVDVFTGEENQEILFKERAKLFRFDKDVKQWKERGVGELKILSKDGRARIVMRRDLIHKLCANHAITPDMKLTPQGNSDRSWVWQTFADFSEADQKAEQLAVRFKTSEIASVFKNTFDECAAGEIPSSTTENANEPKLTSDSEPNLPNTKSDDSTKDDNLENPIVSEPMDKPNVTAWSPATSQSFTTTQAKTVQQSISTSKTVTTKQGASTSSIKF